MQRRPKVRPPPPPGGLLEDLPVAILYALDERVHWVNPAAAELLGRSREALKGQLLFDLVVPDDRPKVEARYWARQNGQSVPRVYEIRVPRGDGAIATVEVIPHALGGKGRRQVVVARDITQRVRGASLVAALSEIAVETQRARTVDGVIARAASGMAALGLRLTLVRRDGNESEVIFVDDANPVVEQIEQLLGRKLLGWRTQVATPVEAQALEGGRSVFVDDLAHLLPSFFRVLPPEAVAAICARITHTQYAQGTIAPLFVQGKRWGTAYLSGGSLTSDDGAALGLFAAQLASSLDAADTIESLERRNQELAAMQVENAALARANARLYEDAKRSYDTLARTQRELVKRERLAALGELAAVVAHEVRNPLAVIFNSLGSIKKLAPLGKDSAMLLDIVGEEADRLNRIVSDLLDFARPHEPALQPESLEDVIGGALEAAGSAVAQGTVRLEMSVARGLPPIPADARMLRQAFINLVVNAIQATPHGGRVRLEASQEQEGDRALARVDVIDEGPGIPAALTEHIFQPFFTTKATGTGLGLAVVKRIVDAHRGEIAFRSSPGAGTTFTVRLPL